MADEELKEGLKEDAKQEALELAEDVTKDSIEHVFTFAINARFCKLQKNFCLT